MKSNGFEEESIEVQTGKKLIEEIPKSTKLKVFNKFKEYFVILRFHGLKWLEELKDVGKKEAMKELFNGTVEILGDAAFRFLGS